MVELNSSSNEMPRYQVPDEVYERQLRDDPNGSLTIELYEDMLSEELASPLEFAANRDLEAIETVIKIGTSFSLRFFDSFYSRAEQSVGQTSSEEFRCRLLKCLEERHRWETLD